MREILFRGKRTDNGEWVYGNYAFTDTNDEQHFIFQNEAFANKVIPETVGQYTGLTDKNGKKIFEGDIINIVYEPSTPTVINLVVEYIGASFYGSNDYDCWELDNYYQIEVIGNIHDNSELLRSDA